ncbi:SDR family NAD(P)-dependent oxidoreductase [Streptomyces sp. NBC_01618]|uniref:SDR family NAD(P)-dependent oxidoreductase n=1 Tax=Streptomyces sp. NBC_01618 TaxID=2975900 RepID=UPI003866A5D2|nr:SDR family NAD(P)-dependent oxidoreductase [Streptomyces sp. NBC_01618]
MSSSRRTALVTGANRGLGLAVSTLLHERGHCVVLAARDGAAAREAAERVGERATGVALDVTDDASVKEAAERVGPVDVLVNNAGILLDAGQPPSEVAVHAVEETLSVNLLGAWRVSQAFLPSMVRNGWGRVVMVSSGTGSFTNGLFVRTPAYAVSKAALNALTVLLAQETGGSGVLVNAVNPGLVRTRMRPDAERLPQEAATDIVWAATLPDGAQSGVFFRSGAVVGW